MSVVNGPARSRAPRTRPEPRRLGLAPLRRNPVRRTPFVLTVVLIGAAGLVGLLVLNTAMQNRAFELSALQEKGDALAVREAALRAEVEALEAPEQVGGRAAGLGMVPNPTPVFLQLKDGRVVGDPAPAKAGTNFPGLEPPAPTASQLAEQRAAEAAAKLAAAREAAR
ncbi:hypothetical protein [Solicola sp. PLA-1-18]|jgi:hypothetical protein|uniref:hypothetical protein n=1 Tax=Solicola sp. PLA-1-18 TaxID=3380532 RepID=UPI003B78131E